MIRVLVALLALLWCAPVMAQPVQRIPTCGTATPGPGASPGYMDSSGGGCVSTGPTVTTGNGSIATSTTTAAINTMTVNANGAPLPSQLGILTVRNDGTSDAALCIAGGTCTCPESGVASTNGITLGAGLGGYIFNFGGRTSSVPTIVSCSGTPVVEFQGW